MDDRRARTAGPGIPGHEAARLWQAATGVSRSAWTAGGVEPNRRQRELFGELCERRRAGEPLQYIEGTAAFGPIEVRVDPRVFIPRPETEQLWERAMGMLPARPCTVVDLGAGSGCLALAVKNGRPDIRVAAADISAGALEVARLNAARLGLEVEFCRGDRLAALDPALRGGVYMILTNPPYIAESDWEGLPSEVRDHEPKTALVMGDGLDMYRYLAAEAAPWLAPDGVLAAEIGEGQGREIERLFADAGWEAAVDRDLAGRDRFLTARRNP